MSFSSIHHRHREHTGNASANSSPVRAPTIPTYEPPLYPLNEAAWQKLSTILQGSTIKNVQTHLEHAFAKISDAAGEANEQLTDANSRYQRMLEKKRKDKVKSDEDDGNGDAGDGEGHEADEARQKLAQTEGRVKSVTAKLEEGIRKTIDGMFMVDELREIVSELASEETNAADDDDDAERGNGNDEDSNEQGNSDGKMKRESDPKPPSNPTSKKFDEKMASKYAGWTGLSLVQR